MFVQVIEAKAKDRDALQNQMEAWAKDVKPGAAGFLGSTAGVSEDGTFVAMARFESEDAARQNSDRPEQSRWWEQTSRYLEDPKFYDCNDVDTFLDGGSDEAGFVQVIQGYATDKDKLRQMMNSMGDSIKEQRPDVLGGVVAWGPDDGFSDFVYFTSEAEARAGETREADSGTDNDEWNDLVRDQRYLDIKEPWLTGP